MKSQSLDFISGEQIGPTIIAAGPLPDAIFAGNDALAMGIINYLTSVGINVPGTVSVLGYDNTAYAESGLIPLSTVSQTPYQLGVAMGAQLLAELSAGIDHVHQHVVFQPKIIERSSTAVRN
jgi:LacI family transcriptional regulator